MIGELYHEKMQVYGKKITGSGPFVYFLLPFAIIVCVYNIIIALINFQSAPYASLIFNCINLAFFVNVFIAQYTADKISWAFSVVFVSYRIIWYTCGLILSLITFFGAMSNVASSFSDAISSNNYIQLGFSIGVSFLSFGIWVSAIFSLIPIMIYMILLVSFIKHRSFFFHSLKEMNDAIDAVEPVKD